MVKRGEIGRLGLKRWSQGILYEEFVPELIGIRGVEAYKEMSNNDSIIGGIMFAIEMLIRQCDFSIAPGGDKEVDRKAAEFVESCMYDMEYTWTDTISEILSFLTYGWSYHEIVYKYRHGKKKDVGLSSKYDDGLIGWAKIPIRSQDTFYEWQYEGDTDKLLGMIQSAPPYYTQTLIPIEKALHFTTKSIKANPEGKSILRTAYRCFDEETEILTTAGWKKGVELSEVDYIATLNPETGKLEYQRAKEINRYEHDGEMIYFNSKFVDICVTDGHRMYVRKDRSDKYEIVQSENVKRSHSIKRWADWNGTQQESYIIDGADIYQKLRNGERVLKERKEHIVLNMSDWLSFLALFLSEGSTTINKRGQRIVSIGQKEGERSDKMRELFKRLPFHCYEHKNIGKINFEFFDIRLFNELVVFGKSKDKYIPHYVKGLDREAIRLFLDWYVFGDGAVVGNTKAGYEGTKVVTTISKRMADDMQELALKAGYEAQISIRNKEPNDLYIISLCKPKDHKIKKIDRINYNGIVWCPTTENGIVYVRRNGKPAWVGNCYYFKKRIEEIEGIGIERDLAGFPVLTPPEGLDIWDSEDPEMVKALVNATEIVTGIRRDAREGLVKPFGWELELLSTGSRRQFDTNQIIDRYNKSIATSVLADFVLMGQQSVGSFALADTKTSLFALAVGTYLDIICEVFNNQGIRRLIDLNENHFQGLTDYPTMRHGDIEQKDLAAFAKYITDLTGAGVLTPDEELEKHVRQVGGLPEKVETGPAEDPKNPEKEKTSKEEATTMYKVQSALDKYRRGTFSRELTSKMLVSIGVSQEDVEEYLSDIDRNKQAQEAEKAEDPDEKDKKEAEIAKQALGRC